MKFRSSVWIILMTVGITACQKEHSFSTRPYPRIVKTEVVETGPDGARFKGELIMGTDPVTDRGFYWGLSRTLYPTASQVVHMGPMDGEDDFEVFVDNCLPPGDSIFVRSFAVSGDITAYGPVTGFVSEGCKLPAITAVTPSPVTYKEELSIYGENFGTNSRLVEVTLSDNIAIRYFSDTLIRVEVPVQLTTQHNEVTVDVMGMKATGTFELYPPVISHISPAEVSLGDTLDIYGDYLKPYPYFQDVYLGSEKCFITFAEKEHVRVLVKSGIVTGRYYHAKIVIGDMNTTSPDSVYIRP